MEAGRKDAKDGLMKVKWRHTLGTEDGGAVGEWGNCTRFDASPPRLRCSRQRAIGFQTCADCGFFFSCVNGLRLRTWPYSRCGWHKITFLLGGELLAERCRTDDLLPIIPVYCLPPCCMDPKVRRLNILIKLFSARWFVVVHAILDRWKTQPSP